MRVYILDVQSKSLEQILLWLSESSEVTEFEVFGDYIKFIEKIEESPPDLCFIRLGVDMIPGLKAAGMVQQISSDIRIIFVSDDKDYALDAYEIGAYGYLVCPVKRDKLEKCLAAYGSNST